MASRRLFLLPGLGADEQLFREIEDVGITVVPVKLPPPTDHETFIEYSSRIGALLQLRPEDWIGGNSFGSLVAADIARRRPVAGLVLIGGALTPTTISLPFRLAALVSRGVPWLLVRPLLENKFLLRLLFGQTGPHHLSLLTDMLARTPSSLLKNGIRLLAQYRPVTQPQCPVFAIHGEHDQLMAPPEVLNCNTVPGAGHALVLTHAAAVREFLRNIVSPELVVKR